MLGTHAFALSARDARIRAVSIGEDFCISLFCVVNPALLNAQIGSLEDLRNRNLFRASLCAVRAGSAADCSGGAENLLRLADDFHERGIDEARRSDARSQEEQRVASLKTARINALLWLCAAAVFGNLAVQLYIRGVDFGFVAVTVAAAAYFIVRWIMSLRAVSRLRKPRQ